MKDLLELSFEAIPVQFEFELWQKILYTLLSVSIICFSLAIQCRVLSFIMRLGRPVDYILRVHTLSSFVFNPISLGFMTALHWSNQLKNYVSDSGCYFIPFLGSVNLFYNGGHSCVIALFRYICILYPEKLTRLGENPAKVSQF